MVVNCEGIYEPGRNRQRDSEKNNDFIIAMQSDAGQRFRINVIEYKNDKCNIKCVRVFLGRRNQRAGSVKYKTIIACFLFLDHSTLSWRQSLTSSLKKKCEPHARKCIQLTSETSCDLALQKATVNNKN